MSDDAFVGALADAIEGHQPFPAFPKGLSLDDGYGLQQQIVERLAPAGAAGLKAGITNPDIQKIFGLEGPVIGRLYPDGWLAQGATVAATQALAIECEIGVLVDGDGIPKAAGPAIEFACVNFSDPADTNGPNLIGCNVGADRFMPGVMLPWRDSYDDVRVSLTKEGEVLNEASMMESLGGPHKAIPYMLAETRKRDMPIKGDMLFMTGTCGQVVSATPGRYRADYGDFGVIEFEVV